MPSISLSHTRPSHPPSRLDGCSAGRQLAILRVYRVHEPKDKEKKTRAAACPTHRTASKASRPAGRLLAYFFFFFFSFLFFLSSHPVTSSEARIRNHARPSSKSNQKHGSTARDCEAATCVRTQRAASGQRTPIMPCMCMSKRKTRLAPASRTIDCALIVATHTHTRTHTHTLSLSLTRPYTPPPPRPPPRPAVHVGLRHSSSTTYGQGQKTSC